MRPWAFHRPTSALRPSAYPPYLRPDTSAASHQERDHIPSSYRPFLVAAAELPSIRAWPLLVAGTPQDTREHQACTSLALEGRMRQRDFRRASLRRSEQQTGLPSVPPLAGLCCGRGDAYFFSVGDCTLSPLYCPVATKLHANTYDESVAPNSQDKLK